MLHLTGFVYILVTGLSAAPADVWKSRRLRLRRRARWGAMGTPRDCSKMPCMPRRNRRAGRGRRRGADKLGPGIHQPRTVSRGGSGAGPRPDAGVAVSRDDGAGPGLEQPGRIARAEGRYDGCRIRLFEIQETCGSGMGVRASGCGGQPAPTVAPPSSHVVGHFLFYSVIGAPAGFMVAIALMEFARQRATQLSAPKAIPVRPT